MLCPICATVLFNFFLKLCPICATVDFIKYRPGGPLFIDGSIVTKVCYSISPLGKQTSVLKKHVKMSTNFKPRSNFKPQSRDIKTV